MGASEVANTVKLTYTGPKYLRFLEDAEALRRLGFQVKQVNEFYYEVLNIEREYEASRLSIKGREAK